MKAQGASKEDITLAKKDLLNVVGSTWLTQLQLDSSLTDIEKNNIARLLQQLMIEHLPTLTSYTGCEYTEQELPIQDLLVGTTLKFKKPMLYIDWKEEKEQYCSPLLASTKFFLKSKSNWESIIFNKSGIIEHQISPSTSFIIEKRILLKKRGLFGNEREYYILRDSNGVLSAPAFFDIFDMDMEGEIGHSGSELYKGNKYIGHVVTEIRSGAVWIQGTEVPKEVIEAHIPKKPSSFDTATAKRTEFMERIMFAIRDEKLVNYTNSEIIDNNLIKGLYTEQNGEIMHNFGGKISVKKNGDYISVIYEKIPAEDECYEFYFINDPQLFGFEESYVDGILESGPYAEFKQKACYSGKENVTIEFKGSVAAIKKQADFIQKANTPRSPTTLR